MKKKLLIIGGHGSGEIAMSIFEDSNHVNDEWDIKGYLSDIVMPGNNLGKYKVLGKTEEIMKYIKEGYFIHNALYFSVKDKENRVNRFKELKIPLELNATAIHPTAIVSPGVEIGNGVLINQYSLLQVNCSIGDFVHVYSGSLVGHESRVRDYCTIGAHAIIGGRVIVNEGAHIGLNASIREDITVGSYAIVGMSAVVTKNVNNNNTVVGNPAKQISNSNI